jgi:hypothetical protein
MKTQKITVIVTIEVLSTDCVPYMLEQVSAQFNGSRENHNGLLQADDGDTVTWKTTKKDISI